MNGTDRDYRPLPVTIDTTILEDAGGNLGFKSQHDRYQGHS
jgi:hypothetical protein